ncbi:MAG TPA: hypothetical protein VG944_14685 [Fimbriimonas sp.]|nr:hypothetical protein [Fimbriimonas sp.]
MPAPQSAECGAYKGFTVLSTCIRDDVKGNPTVRPPTSNRVGPHHRPYKAFKRLTAPDKVIEQEQVVASFTTESGNRGVIKESLRVGAMETCGCISKNTFASNLAAATYCIGP